MKQYGIRRRPYRVSGFSALPYRKIASRFKRVGPERRIDAADLRVHEQGTRGRDIVSYKEELTTLTGMIRFVVLRRRVQLFHARLLRRKETLTRIESFRRRIPKRRTRRVLRLPVREQKRETHAILSVLIAFLS